MSLMSLMSLLSLMSLNSSAFSVNTDDLPENILNLSELLVERGCAGFGSGICPGHKMFLISI